MIITWSDWQQRLELVEPAPELTPEQEEACKRIIRHVVEDVERCMLGLPPIVR